MHLNSFCLESEFPAAKFTAVLAIMEQTRLVSLRHAGELAGVQT